VKRKPRTTSSHEGRGWTFRRRSEAGMRLSRSACRGPSCASRLLETCSATVSAPPAISDVVTRGRRRRVRSTCHRSLPTTMLAEADALAVHRWRAWQRLDAFEKQEGMFGFARGKVRKPPARLRCISLRRLDRPPSSYTTNANSNCATLDASAAAMWTSLVEETVVVVS
jgi:hypothetical protein